MPKLCSACGNTDNPDDGNFCIACGKAIDSPPNFHADSASTVPDPEPSAPKRIFRKSLILTGASGSVRFNISTDVGQRIYRQIAGDESRFVATIQYHIIRSEEDKWFIAGKKAMPQRTLLNGASCEGEHLPLKDGDCIAMASRNDPVRTAAEVKVTIEQED